MKSEPQVIVITGTSSGIGKILASYLTEKGNKVYGLSRSIPKDVNFTTISTDVSELESFRNAITQILKEETKIDALINNAGKGMVGSVEDADPQEIKELFNLNLIGAVNGIKSVVPQFRKQNQGKIINISSIGSRMGLPFRGYYSASKAALDMITEAVRYEIEDMGIQATTLHLGDIKTNIAENRIQSEVGDAYSEIFDRVYKGMNAHVDKGTEPEKVATYISKLIQKKNLKPHYYFAKPMQKLSIFIKKVLPQTWFEKLIKIYSGL